MKITKLTFLFSLLILCAFAVSSCGDDDDDNSGSGDLDCTSSVEINNAVAAEADAAATAASTWGMDPSDANCNALKTAYQNYIEALNDVLDCAKDAGLGEEYNSLIALTESGLDGLIC